ncbi:MAG: 3-methyl-2-oxobutanoate hydroxymethyltransferase, partial [Clostridia bacterium]|nr:3-methyl-2-oxobutanoate hydroxymethyltransferase [Clostridia bacterium]
MMSENNIIKKVTTQTLQQMKDSGEKISMLTCYDYSTAKIFDA